jgi:hypothetical protein
MVEFLVTVPAGTGGGYYIDGVQKPIIPVVTGGTFRFNQNNANNNTHPLALSTTTSTAGRITTGVVYYLDGISTQADYYNLTLFNAATTRYIEITVAQTSDFYYICNVHGAGMGNVMDVTSNTWSALSWNVGNWSDQADIDFIPTGINLTTSLNSVDAFPNEGWGSDRWGIENWGESGLNVTVTGNSLSTTVGGPAFDWGESSWNSSELNWGGFSNVTIALGMQVDVTGLQLNTSLNSVTEIITVDAFVTGLQLNTSLNEVDTGPDANVTGEQLNLSVGTVQAYNVEGWGRETWGEDVWGAEGLWEEVSVTGLQLNVSQGNEGEQIDVTVELSSISPVGWGVVGWSEQSWNDSEVDLTQEIAQGEVDPSPDVTVVGIGMTVTLDVGTVVIGTGNVTLTGQQLNIAQGTAIGDANTIASVTGIGLNIAVGTVFAGGTSVIEVTGNGLTIALNSINNQIWTEINTGTDATWIEIDTAA